MHEDAAGPLPPAIAILLLATAAPASAQQLTVAVGRGSSAFAEFATPASLALQARLPLAPVPFLQLQASYRHRWQDGRRPGTTCDVYWPVYDACVEEPIAYETRLDQVEAGLGVGGTVLEHLELRGAVLITRNSLVASSRGVETKRSAGRFYPDAIVWSTALEGGVAWTPWVGGHLGVTARVRYETLDFKGCATDVRTPFCGEEGLMTFEIGAVVAR